MSNPVGPVVAAPTANYANKEGRVLRARGNLQKAGLQGLSQRHVPALAVETQVPLTCKRTVVLGMTIKRWRRFSRASVETV